MAADRRELSDQPSSPLHRGESTRAAIELQVGGPAAGGGFVAHDEHGRVVFVRHALPGERVVAVLTEEHATWARADAVEILEDSVDRVPAPCPHAGAGKCGGCDYQHVALDAQRRFKRTLLSEQLRRVAGVELDIEVDAVLASRGGLGTRTRVRYGVDDEGRLGLRRHGSHELVAVGSCPLGVERFGALQLASRRFAPGCELETISLSAESAPTLVASPGEAGDTPVRQRRTVDGLELHASPGVFFQVHDGAPEVLVAAVLEGLALTGGEHVCDLYCGVGLFTAAIAHAVGPAGHVVGVDASRLAIADANDNLGGFAWASARRARLDALSTRVAVQDCSHVVFDPPRRGLDAAAAKAIDAAPSVTRIVSVSCEPSTFARDVRRFLDRGWQLASVRSFDLFEMTEHLECVGVLERA
jgi:tRNA/tmRNA/rRNA uracil-C5-methylase (TrmA/RlmC/RlmD family)